MLISELLYVYRTVTTLSVGDFGTTLAWVRKADLSLNCLGGVGKYLSVYIGKKF